MKNFECLAVRHQSGRLEFLDQQLLPHEERWLEAKNPQQMFEMIHALKIRGAPLIGVGAALYLAKCLENPTDRSAFEETAHFIRRARPTAVNLMWAVDRILAAKNPVQEAIRILNEDIELCRKMGENGAALIEDNDGILTHCNTGGLATSGIGTALGVIRTAHEQGKKVHVYVDETRPLLQGARLTTWELEKLRIPYTLICDNMAAILMKQKRIQKIFVGSDRIAMNGDFANKVGTYSVSVLARHHNIPFYPVAPITTVDPKCKNGSEIPIEERSAEEVQGGWSPKQAQVFNPAFDVTPVDLVTALVLDKGVYPQKQLELGALHSLIHWII